MGMTRLNGFSPGYIYLVKENMIKNAALESIQFQKTDLFNGITQCISKTRDKGAVNDKDFYSGDLIKELSDVIFKYTGFNFKFEDCDFGPATYLPRLNQHIFDDAETLELFKEYIEDYDLHKDATKVLKALDVDMMEGGVSLKNSKVTGFFTKLECTMFLPRDYLLDTTFTNEELSAIVLHELGHVFTTCEYLDRSVKTNQALSVMLKVMDKSSNYEEKKVIFTKAKEKISLDDDAFKTIIDSKDKNLVTLVVLNQQVEACKSELGASVYDVTSCEYLADQFAARHGAGRHLVTSLDKLFSRGMPVSSPIYMSMAVMSAGVVATMLLVGGVAGLVASIPVVLLLTVTGIDTASKMDVGYISDNEFTRLSRIKHQMVQRLKDTSISKEEKKVIVNYLEEVEPIIKKYAGQNDVKLRNRIAFFFSKKHKYDFEFMRLQKDLEEMGNSDLFIMSEKLKQL